ncbi:MAG: formate--tetrahydrofolate ligase, partial [Armatimonadia bacterium]|nr:formate--tetrahydrofolate ligase [Armatimonadia bacterium]
AQSATLRPITDVAEEIGIQPDELSVYGRDKAKVDLSALGRLSDAPDGKLVLVTAMTPTKSGEGKSTITVGLGQALRRAGKKAVVALREASLGPCLGMKGGACGGGYSQVLPMEDINLHFTGDMHAVTAAHNSLAALLDSHLHFGNEVGLDVRSITWPRVMDMCDRALRDIIIGLGGKMGGVPRENYFQITAASEVMAILCLARDLNDLKDRLSNIIVGSRPDGSFVPASDLSAAGAMALLLKDAIKPNLVQTVEGGPAFVHGGPFANIAHGCNTVLATRMALKLGEMVVTEAGFASDLGAEKFFNIKCRKAGLRPDAAVISCTLKATKRAGGGDENQPHAPNADALKAGIVNIEAHVDNVRQHGVPAIVAINRFAQDTEDELALLKSMLDERGIPSALCDAYGKGGEGCADLAVLVTAAAESGEADFQPLYPDDASLADKIGAVATKVYGADGVELLPKAKKALAAFEAAGLGNLPVCMAKTQYSLSDDQSLVGRPKGFQITVRDATISAGAGFVVALLGEMMTMPGLVRTPAMVNMDIDEDGTIEGLF